MQLRVLGDQRKFYIELFTKVIEPVDQYTAVRAEQDHSVRDRSATVADLRDDPRYVS